MLFAALAFLTGITLFQQLAELPDAGYGWLAAVLPLLRSRRAVLRNASMAVAGFLWAWWQAAAMLDQHLPDGLAGQDLLVEGVVTAMPEDLPNGRRRFRMQLERYRQDGGWRPLDLPVRLNWYRNAPRLVPGERWQLVVRLKPPRGFANPGGFDYERWLFAHGIRATGYVRRDDRNRRRDEASGYRLERLRQSVGERLRVHGDDATETALVLALSLGDRSAMTRDQWQVLRNTGTSHLLAISGLHVGLVSGLVFFLVRHLWGRAGRPERWPAPSVAALAAIAAALAYAALAGFQIPVQRAVIMVSVWMLSLLWPTRPDPWRVWSLALLLVLLRDPLAVLSAGFWLSFGAVAWILFLGLGRRGRSGRLRQTLRLQLGIVLGLLPLSWLWFQEASLLAPLANLVAIPWVGVLVMPLLLAGLALLPAPSLADAVLGLGGTLLGGLWWFLERLAAWPEPVWHLPSVSGGALLLLAIGIACLLAPRALPLRVPGVLLVLPALLTPVDRPTHGQVRFTLLDVGQGLSAVIETRSRLLVYDTGPAWPGGLNTGEAVVAPFLRARGFRSIDTLIVSHADNDHRGGAHFLLEHFPTGRIYSGEPGEIGADGVQRCSAGQRWMYDGVWFEFLAPLHPAQGNNASCVLRVETASGFVILLPGDIEASVERQLLATRAGRLQADVLVGPHHGSLTSSLPAFIDAVDPELVLFATGYRNRFGFPRAQVVQRYRKQGAVVLDTAGSGAILIRTRSGGAARVLRHREHRPAYWNSPAEGFVSR